MSQRIAACMQPRARTILFLAVTADSGNSAGPLGFFCANVTGSCFGFAASCFANPIGKMPLLEVALIVFTSTALGRLNERKNVLTVRGNASLRTASKPENLAWTERPYGRRGIRLVEHYSRFTGERPAKESHSALVRRPHRDEKNSSLLIASRQGLCCR